MGSRSAVGESINNDALASLLRECASIVEQNESSVILFRAVEALNQYAESSDARSKVDGGDRRKHHPSSTSTTTVHSKPAFQRPTNTKSTLIANGWVEQQRRSKFRVVWKHVLASLVEARRPGEGA
jgi:hypothetical protein